MDLNERRKIQSVAVAAAEEAGRLLLQHLGRLDPARIENKSNYRDLVTQADLASEALLVERVRSVFPDHEIEAEEQTNDRDGGRPRWLIDPLDGTVNFVQRLPCFAVSMGVWADGEPQVAVVHLPVLRETYTAVLGGGATLNGRPIGVSRSKGIRDAILATGFAYRRSDLEPSNLEHFSSFFHEARGLRRMGSAAIDLAFVADGRLDGYWEFHLSPHDVAAGGLLVQEAGGVVSDIHGHGDWLRGGSILAAGPALHEAMLAHLGAL